MKGFHTQFICMLFCILFNTALIAQKGPEVDVQSIVYRSLENPFVEIYIGVLNKSILPVDSNQIKQAKQVQLISYIQKADKISHVTKINLTFEDGEANDIFDIQRKELEVGSYNVVVEVIDLQDTSRKFTVTKKIIVPDLFEKITLSPIQILARAESASTANENSRFVKNGILFEPLKYNYINSNYKKIFIYSETYNMEKGDAKGGILEYLFVKEQANKKDTVLQRFKRRDNNLSIDPYLISEAVDEEWESGTYKLVVNFRNIKKELISFSNTNFILNNAIGDEKSLSDEQLFENSFVHELSLEKLAYSLKAIAAKVDPSDVDRLNLLIADGSEPSKKSFLHNFWSITNAVYPEVAYQAYMEVAEAIDNMYYYGFGPGFDSDRGYIYLRYGQPDHIVDEVNDPTAPPYEIWTYARFPHTGQSNVKFVFYNPSLVHNNYVTLHSTARGERNNPQWLIQLYSNSPEDQLGNSIDATDVKDYFNRRAAELFNDN